MHMKKTRSSFVLALFAAGAAAAKSSWDCQVTIDKVRFNLQALGGLHTLGVSHATPPTVTNTTYAVDLCAALPIDKEIDAAEQCPEGTYVCRTKVALKGDTSTVLEVLAMGAESPAASRDKDVLTLTYQGGKNGDGDTQKTVVELQCDKEAGPGEPSLVSDRAGVVTFQWKTVHACEDDPERDVPPPSKPSSHWGFFTW